MFSLLEDDMREGNGDERETDMVSPTIAGPRSSEILKGVKRGTVRMGGRLSPLPGFWGRCNA